MPYLWLFDNSKLAQNSFKEPEDVDNDQPGITKYAPCDIDQNHDVVESFQYALPLLIAETLLFDEPSHCGLASVQCLLEIQLDHLLRNCLNEHFEKLNLGDCRKPKTEGDCISEREENDAEEAHDAEGKRRFDN